MASFSAPAFLATNTLRPTAALSTKNSSAIARKFHQTRTRIWQPMHGIIFGNIQSSAEPSPRSLSTITATSSEHDPFLKPNTADSCLLESSINVTSSNSRRSDSGSQNIIDTDDDFWAKPNAPQDSAVECLGIRDEIPKKVEQDVQRDDYFEPHPPLAFRIPKDVLQKAKDAAPGSNESFWSYKMYLGPQNQEVKVHYCKSKQTTERVAQYFLNEAVLGFDIEWKPESTKNSSVKNNVALIQLASESRIALFHIAAFPKDTVPDLVALTLKEIMENPAITKVGVAIKADCTRLRNFLDINPRGIFELSHLYKLVKYSISGDLSQINKRLVSLSTQAEEYLELPIFKGEVRASDWTQFLSIEQIKYAASDAYANFILYHTLEAKRKSLQPLPPQPYHAELNLPIGLASGAVIAATDDMEDLEPLRESTVASSIAPASALEAAAENIQIEDDTEQIHSSSKPKIRTRLKTTKSSSLATALPKPETLVNAESWALAHRASNSPPSPSETSPLTANFSALRVYALWYYNSSLSIADIASMLRDPPLRNSTVAVYILEAIRLEKLPFEKERLKTALQVVPDSQKLWRYKGLWKVVE